MDKTKKEYLVTAVLFGTAALVHIIGYFTNYLYAIGWLLWVPAIVLTVRCLIQIKKDGYIKKRKIRAKKIKASAEFILLVLTAVYVVFNIIYNCLILRYGGGEYTDGIYYLINLGERIREITKEDYSRLLLAEYRLFTGQILVIYAAVLCYLKIKKMEQES